MRSHVRRTSRYLRLPPPRGGSDWQWLIGRTLALLLLIQALLSASACLAHSAALDSSHQWGVGWDNGIGLRHRLGEHWGLGLGLGGNYTREAGAEGEIHAVLMVFRRVTFGSVFGVGPYLLVRPFHKSIHNGDETISNGTAVGIGLRPVFRFWHRLELETRLGVDLTYTHSTYRDFGPNGAHTTRSNGWAVGSSGGSLGPGALLQFMIYF